MFGCKDVWFHLGFLLNSVISCFFWRSFPGTVNIGKHWEALKFNLGFQWFFQWFPMWIFQLWVSTLEFNDFQIFFVVLLFSKSSRGPAKDAHGDSGWKKHGGSADEGDLGRSGYIDSDQRLGWLGSVDRVVPSWYKIYKTSLEIDEEDTGKTQYCCTVSVGFQCSTFLAVAVLKITLSHLDAFGVWTFWEETTQWRSHDLCLEGLSIYVPSDARRVDWGRSVFCAKQGVAWNMSK